MDKLLPLAAKDPGLAMYRSCFSFVLENDPRILEQRNWNRGLFSQSGQTVRHCAEGSVQDGDHVLSAALGVRTVYPIPLSSNIFLAL